MGFMIVFQQMLVLFAMMVVGYVCYKKGMIEERGTKTLSSIIVNVLNPILMISSVLGDEVTYSAEIIKQNLIMVVIYFVLLIILGLLITKLFRVGRADAGSYRLMLIFSNLGFMGIPLATNLFGAKSVILLAFYMITYNVLIYTYGIYLATQEREDTVGAGLPLKKILNPGVVGCAVAIIIFAFQIRVPDFVGTFADYMGNAVIPLAMMMVGVNLAKIDLKSIFQDIRLLIMSALKLILIPIACVFIFRNLGFDATVFGIFILVISMPVGTVILMIETEYGRDDNALCAKGITLTTLLTLITIPVVLAFI